MRLSTAATLGAIVLSVALVAGCAAEPVGTVGPALQKQVVAVAEASADSEYQQALDLLDELQASLDGAIDAGTISTTQAVSVQQSIDDVRADLDALLEPEEEPEPVITNTPVTVEPTPETPEEPAEPAKPGKGNNNKDNKPGKDKKNKP